MKRAVMETASNFMHPETTLEMALHQNPAIEIDDVSLRFQTSDGPVQALSGVSLKIAGASSSRSSARRAAARRRCCAPSPISSADRGDIRVNGMSAAEARLERAYGYVFQAPALYPWRTVAAQYRAAAGDHGLRQGRARKRVERGLELVNLEGLRRQIPLAIVGRHAAARLDRPRACRSIPTCC